VGTNITKGSHFCGPFLFYSPREKRLPALWEELEWFGLQAEPASRNVTESLRGHQVIIRKPVDPSAGFFFFMTVL
jgi:hypothetical protein